MARRDIASLSQAEVDRLVAAFDAIKDDGTYDGFVERHQRAMAVAHQNPRFDPWHRAQLVELEDALQAVDPSIELPYWNWAQDLARYGDPRSSPLFTDRYFGTSRFSTWRALIFNSSTGSFQYRSATGLVRNLGANQAARNAYPTAKTVKNLLDNFATYDASPWNTTVRSFRNRQEGFFNGPALHNVIHNWVGGDMLTGTSPNDPLFFLHHCNVDRIWWTWQRRYKPDYRPEANGSAGMNVNDRMPFLLRTWRPADVLRISNLGYSYA